MGSAVLVAVAVGVGVAVQVTVLGRAAVRLHPLSVSLGLQLAGVLAGALWASLARGWSGVGQTVVAWWWLPLGVFGWALVAGVTLLATRTG